MPVCGLSDVPEDSSVSMPWLVDALMLVGVCATPLSPLRSGAIRAKIRSLMALPSSLIQLEWPCNAKVPQSTQGVSLL